MPRECGAAWTRMAANGYTGFMTSSVVEPHPATPAVTAIQHDAERPPDRRGRGQPHGDATPRRSLLDLLDAEIDALDGLSPDEKARIKQKVRSRFGVRREPDHHPDPHPDAGDGARPPAAVPPTVPSTVEAIIQAVLHAKDTTDPEVADDRRLAEQLRRLLETHSQAARNLATYVHALQAQHDDLHRPHVVVVA